MRELLWVIYTPGSTSALVAQAGSGEPSHGTRSLQTATRPGMCFSIRPMRHGGSGRLRRAVAALGVMIASVLTASGLAGAYEPVGSDLRISNAGTDGDTDPNVGSPAVAFNPSANEYLVVWTSDGPPSTSLENEVFGQRMSATGAELGSDFRISNTGPDGDNDPRRQPPRGRLQPTANEYLVTWNGAASPLTTSSRSSASG